MKRLIFSLLTAICLLPTLLNAQALQPNDRTRVNQVLDDRATWSRYFMGVPHGATPHFPAYVPDSLKCGALFYKVNPGVDTTLMTYNCLDSSWTKVGAGAAFTVGTVITSLPAISDATATPQDFVNLFYQSMPPTAALTGGTVYELTTSNQTHNLSWTYGRQSATATISSADINPGTFHEFGSQPTQPGTTSGTQSVTTTANTNTTYTFLVTTADAKTASATTTDTFSPRFYYGRSSVSSPTSTQLLAFAGGNDPLTASRAQAALVITASGSNYPFFSYPTSEGAVTLIKDVNGFDVTTAFNQTTVSLTNSQGYTQNYYVYTLNAATSSNYTITTN